MRTLRIALDAMGGDHAPSAPVAGALEAMRELSVEVILVGPEAVVQQELERQQPRASRRATNVYPSPSPSPARGEGIFSLGPRVVDAPEVIGMAEEPVAAVRAKRKSSIVVGLDLVARGEAEGFVTAGNTGAAMAAAVFGLKRIEGIDRPALAIPFPARDGACLMLDVGASAEARPHNLVQFALMGAVYAERVLGVQEPRVALLSIGEEETKGNALVKEAHQQLRESGLRFVGNVEGKDIAAGAADVVVMDGFVGNVLLKFAEGVGTHILNVIRSEIRADPISTLLGLGLTGAFRRVRTRLDYAEYGGAPLLGVNGVCIIAHGRSNARAIRNAVRVAAEAAAGSVVERIREGLARQQATGDG